MLKNEIDIEYILLIKSQQNLKKMSPTVNTFTDKTYQVFKKQSLCVDNDKNLYLIIFL